MTGPAWLSFAQAARQRGVTVNSLHHARRQGHLVCAQPGGPGTPWFVTAASLAAWSPAPRGRRPAQPPPDLPVPDEEG